MRQLRGHFRPAPGALHTASAGGYSRQQVEGCRRRSQCMKINAARLRSELESLARFGAEPTGGVTRPALSEADIQARHWYAEKARQAGLAVHVDGLFNVTARFGASSQPAVWCGSHLDSVPQGGMFDGALGAMAALECVRRLREEAV